MGLLALDDDDDAAADDADDAADHCGRTKCNATQVVHSSYRSYTILHKRTHCTFVRLYLLYTNYRIDAGWLNV